MVRMGQQTACCTPGLGISLNGADLLSSRAVVNAERPEDHGCGLFTAWWPLWGYLGVFA